MAETLLDLQTQIARPSINIDGKRYEILAVDELSVLDTQRFGTWQRRLEELQNDSDRSDDDPEIEDLVTTISHKVLIGVPDDIFAKLSGIQKIAVVEVFTGLLLRNRMGVAGATARAMGNSQIGESFSHAFNGSTADHRQVGWWTRLWRWFGLS